MAVITKASFKLTSLLLIGIIIAPTFGGLFFILIREFGQDGKKWERIEGCPIRIDLNVPVF